VNWLR
jgi:hypothetical protein